MSSMAVVDRILPSFDDTVGMRDSPVVDFGDSAMQRWRKKQRDRANLVPAAA
jgi:hypothetical protein